MCKAWCYVPHDHVSSSMSLYWVSEATLLVGHLFYMKSLSTLNLILCYHINDINCGTLSYRSLFVLF